TRRPSFFLRVPLTKPRTECSCHAVRSMISASVAPAGRRIRSITSACLLSFRETGSSRVVPRGLGEGLVALPRFGSPPGEEGSPGRNSVCTALQIRATATLRLGNFFNGFSRAQGGLRGGGV